MNVEKRRPRWMVWLYLAFMTLTFGAAGLGLPWYAPYLGELAVIGLGGVYLLIRADFSKLDTISSFLFINLSGYLWMLVLSMTFWLLDLSKSSEISRGCSTILYQVIGLLMVSAAVYLFRERAVDYTLYAMLGANALVVLRAVKRYGGNEFGAGLATLFRSGGLETPPPVKAIEVHDLTFAMGMMALYYLIDGNWERRRGGKALLTLLFFLLGYKRIAFAGFAAVILLAMALRYLGERRQKQLLWLCGAAVVAGSFCYVYLIHSGLFDQAVERLGIDTMGRVRLYHHFQSMYKCSPLYRGKGIGFVARYLEDRIASGNPVQYYVSALHNDVLTLYIELGWAGFLGWMLYQVCGRTAWAVKRYGIETGKLLLYGTVYCFITYMTDNTAFYCAINIVCGMLPVAFAMKEKRNEAHGKVQRKERGP